MKFFHLISKLLFGNACWFAGFCCFCVSALAEEAPKILPLMSAPPKALRAEKKALVALPNYDELTATRIQTCTPHAIARHGRSMAARSSPGDLHELYYSTGSREFCRTDGEQTERASEVEGAQVWVASRVRSGTLPFRGGLSAQTKSPDESGRAQAWRHGEGAECSTVQDRRSARRFRPAESRVR